MSRPGHPPDTLPRPILRWAAAFCAVTIWLLGLLAGSPDLHASLHQDASLAGHSCAITLFHQGAEDPAPQVFFVTAPQLVVLAAAIPHQPRRAESPEDWLRPGRGPPVR